MAPGLSLLVDASVYAVDPDTPHAIPGYQPPPETKPWVFDLTKTRLLGLKDWIASAKRQKEVRDAWQRKFQ